MYVLANIIGVLAIITWSLSIQNKDKKGILIYQVAASVLYGVQYFLLGAFSACLMDFTSALRCLIFYFEDKKRGKVSNISFILFAIIILIFGIISFKGIISILPIITSLIGLYSIWQNNLNKTRYLFIVNALIWLFYNFSVGAYVNIIGNFFEILSGIISIIRFRRNK